MDSVCRRTQGSQGSDMEHQDSASDSADVHQFGTFYPENHTQETINPTEKETELK